MFGFNYGVEKEPMSPEMLERLKELANQNKKHKNHVHPVPSDEDMKFLFGTPEEELNRFIDRILAKKAKKGTYKYIVQTFKESLSIALTTDDPKEQEIYGRSLDYLVQLEKEMREYKKENENMNMFHNNYAVKLGKGLVSYDECQLTTDTSIIFEYANDYFVSLKQAQELQEDVGGTIVTLDLKEYQE